MARNYLAFGSDDKENWAQLKTVEAGGAPQALNLARAQESHRYYAVVPERNWSSAEPEVEERPPLVRWKALVPGQMKFEDDGDDKSKTEAKEERNVL